MRCLKRHYHSLVLTLVAALVSCCVALPTALLAGTETANENLGHKRFLIELCSGFALLNPSDLNLFVDYDNRFQEFTYDTYLDYLRNNGLIQSWNKSTEGERKKIKNALPLGIRFKYYVLDFLAVSIGFEYLQRHHSNDLDFHYTRDELNDQYYLETLSFSPYGISVWTYQPFIGIHIFKQFSRSLTVEGFVSGGPLFTKFTYESAWNYLWVIEGPGYSWRTYESNGLLEENGKGTGISLEVGGRLSVPVIPKLEAFLEGGYAYQVVKNLSGSGREVQVENTETWDGDWGIMRDAFTTSWGTLDLRFPTNRRLPRDEVEEFSLDLSGFRIRIGFSLVF